MKKSNVKHELTSAPVLLEITSELMGQRLDILLPIALPGYSRSFFKNLITNGHITLNGQVVTKSGYLAKLGDRVKISFPVFNPDDFSKTLPNLDVKIIFEHSDFLIISKPAGLVVHAPQHEYAGVTLVDWLLAYFKEISVVGSQDRPGIVHRLDMHTSGLMIIPRNGQAHAVFTEMFKNRQINKTYLAVVSGHPQRTGQIDYHIVRHPTCRNKMTHVKPQELTQNWAKKARHAQTFYQVVTYFDDYSLVSLRPITGRTHQIRVHMAAIGHILVGDVVYGYKNLNKTCLIARHALHAHRLEFVYQNQAYSFSCDLPEDLKKLVNQ